MAKKGIFMSVTATAVIASAFIGAESVDAASHKVKNGDNLWTLAQKYDTTVAQLKKLNELSNDMIYVNQVLEVGDNVKSTSTSTSNSSSTNKSSTSTTSDGSTYTVKSGDTLSHIAAKHGVTVNNLMSWNNLSSTNIFPGNKLTLKNGGSSNNSSGSSSSTPNKNTSNNSSNKGSTASGSTYTVKKGDTLGAIASKHGVSLANVMSWNNISSASKVIYPGDKIVVKAGASSSNSSSNSSSSNNSSSNSSSSNSSSSSSSASTYTVKSGDNLGAIASKHGVSLANVMSWNNISSSSQIIYPGDKIIVKAGTSSNNSSSSSSNTSSNNSSSSSNSSSSTSSASTYTVKSGDTLGSIASKHGVSLKNLMSWNNLGSSLIFPGDKLVLKEGATPPSNNNSSSNSSSSNSNTNSNSGSSVGSSNPTPPAASGDLVSTAKSVMGTPYVWGGSQPGGFDCSGFIQWAHNNSGKSIPRLSVAGYDNRSYEVSNPQVGDLVFFKGTYGGPNHMSHMGIYLGGGNFIHAGSSSGVTITNLSNSYWSKHFDSYKRFY